MEVVSAKIESRIQEIFEYVRRSIPIESGESVSTAMGWNTVKYKRNFVMPIPVGVFKPFNVTYKPPKVTVTPVTVSLPSPETVPEIGEITGITEIPKPEKLSISLTPLTSISLPTVNIAPIPIPPDWGNKAYWEGLGITAAIAAGIGYNPYAWWDPLLSAKAVFVTGSAILAAFIGNELSKLYRDYVKKPLETINSDVIGNPTNPKSNTVNYALNVTRAAMQNGLNTLIGNPDSPAVGSLNYLIKYGIGIPADNPPKNSLNWILQKMHENISQPLYNFGKDIKAKLQGIANTLIDKLNSSISKLHRNTSTAMESMSVAMAQVGEGAINAAISKVYELMGLMSGMGMTPVLLMPEPGGFKWWAPQSGVTLMYIVVEGKML